MAFTAAGGRAVIDGISRRVGDVQRDRTAKAGQETNQEKRKQEGSRRTRETRGLSRGARVTGEVLGFFLRSVADHGRGRSSRPKIA